MGRFLQRYSQDRAWKYAQSQRKYLEQYLLDGRLEISNNRAERSIKPFVIGRKNFLFANTHKGAKVSTVLYSPVETAKENGVALCDDLTQAFCLAPNGSMDDPAFLNNLLPAAFMTAISD